MKLTLEKAELIQLIGNSLGYELNEEDVTVTAEPFEVRIQNVNLGEMAAAKPPPDIDPGFAVDPMAVDEDPEEETAAQVLTMADILNQNEIMGGATVERTNGPQEYDEPPPVTQEELTAARGTQRG
jgi:hypothetical protein